MNILIFGGTTEGHILSDEALKTDHKIYVCVATEYGKKLLTDDERLNVHIGRMDENEMCEFICDNHIDICYDATHPYATAVSQNAKRACDKCGISYIRVTRSESATDEYTDAVYVDTVDEAVKYLANTTGNIFITTGSKEIAKYSVIEDFKNRCFARVLPSVQAIESCEAAGLSGKNIICMQGPFDESMNISTINMTNARYLVTKSSGTAGGFEEKLEAAYICGITPVIIGRPVDMSDESIDLDAAILKITGFEANVMNAKKKVYLIGVGLGDKSFLLPRASMAINSCDVLIGAKRMLDVVSDEGRQIRIEATRSEDIKKHLDNMTGNIAGVLFSGDIGMFSGAGALSKLIEDEYEIERIPGISSGIYLCDKLSIDWSTVHFDSIHGRNVDVVSRLVKYGKIVLLVGKTTDISDICTALTEYGLGESKLYIGERLSYPEERITQITANEGIGTEYDSLSVVYIERNMDIEIPRKDEDFVRGNVPMTKEEVRTAVIGKLELNEEAVLYDIGAGTGSVSIQAQRMHGCKVYAIEKNPEGVDLIRTNAHRNMASGVIPVYGEAPQILQDLINNDPPTHVFIGGSHDKLFEIIDVILRSNPYARFVITAITLETLGKLLEIEDRYPQMGEVNIIKISAQRMKKLGKYHSLDAMNDVYICSFGQMQVNSL